MAPVSQMESSRDWPSIVTVFVTKAAPTVGVTDSETEPRMYDFHARLPLIRLHKFIKLFGTRVK
jgi:hypothetical protein